MGRRRRSKRFVPDQFQIKITDPEMLHNGNTVIPKLFWSHYKNELCRGFDIVAINGKIWPLQATIRGNQGVLDGRWRFFCVWYAVEEGDSIVFTRIAPSTYTAKHFIKKGDQLPPSDDEDLNDADSESDEQVTSKPKSKTQSDDIGKINIGSSIGPEPDTNERTQHLAKDNDNCTNKTNDNVSQSNKILNLNMPETEVVYRLDNRGELRRCFTVVLPPNVKTAKTLEFPMEAVPFMQQYKAYKWPIIFQGKLWQILLTLDEEQKKFVLSEGWKKIKANEAITPGTVLRFEVHEGFHKSIYLYIEY